MDALINPDQVWSISDLLIPNCPIPSSPGVYAWFFKEIPPLVPIEGCINWQGMSLLYIGISPARPSTSTNKISKQNLKTRIRNHLRGNAYGSTLRLTLGCLLGEELGIHLQKVGSKRCMHFAQGEKILSQWMEKNAFVTWVIYQKPWELEEELIGTLNLPLNLKGNENHPFYPILSQIRRGSKLAAL